MTRLAARTTCLLLAVLLGGCAAPAQPSLLATQQVAAPAPAERQKLFYIGLALYAESWSHNDVVALANALRLNADFDVVPLIASNFAPASRGAYPLASDAAIALLVSQAADQAGPDDIVFVHISTHGAPGMLARQIGDREPTSLSARNLARKLAPLGGHRTIIVLSACYSGSLIGALRAPERIIVTAARADRSSFGCAAGKRHTDFGDAELHGFGERGRSLRQVFATIRADVAHMEDEDQLRPSEPQVWVGGDVIELYDAPVF